MGVDFEKSFSDFLDRKEYDEAHSALFSIVRAAYKAGWSAAGGNPPTPQGVLHLLNKDKGDEKDD